MRQTEILQLEPALLTIAKSAGNAILDIYDTPDHAPTLVHKKPDDSPLTAADLSAHKIIKRELEKLTPEYPVVSEEDEGSFKYRRKDSTFWLIDPLDGTKEFIARNGEFTVNIALVSNGTPIWGVVHAPVLGETFWGGPGLGAHKQTIESNVVKIQVAQWLEQKSKRVVASKSHLNAETSAFISALGKHSLIQAGSSLKFCKIAEGKADVYPRLAPTCEWDTAAAQAVLVGAGGYVFQLSGQPLEYGKPEVLNPSFIAASNCFDVICQPND